MEGMMKNKEFSMLFEVICSFRPTEYDTVGCDGMYVKEVRRITSQPIPGATREYIATLEKLLAERDRLLAEIPLCPDHGAGCVPHAIEWVRAHRTEIDSEGKEDKGG